MFKEFYQLSADPFRLTPDHRFAYSHQSYRHAHANMRYALDKGDGVLVVSGRSGTGKTTLVQDFLAGMASDDVVTATVVSTHLQEDDVLRMVAYAFDLEPKDLDKATLLRELETFLQRQSRALLIIDEAQNLTEAALEEVRMLTNLHVKSRQLLQVFLVGQEKLHERLHTQSMEQLHQRLMAVCDLKPLTLQETCDFIGHRLGCAGWSGYPEITAEALILVHRCSQGLPRYICKLCARLFLQGAIDHRNRITADDVAAQASALQGEQLLPLASTQNSMASVPILEPQTFLQSEAGPIGQRLSLTEEECNFLANNPATLTTKSAPLNQISTPLGASAYKAVKSWFAVISQLDWNKGFKLAIKSANIRAFAALLALLFLGGYLWGVFNTGRQSIDSESNKSLSHLQPIAVQIPLKTSILWGVVGPGFTYDQLIKAPFVDLLGLIGGQKTSQGGKDAFIPGPLVFSETIFGQPDKKRAAVRSESSTEDAAEGLAKSAADVETQRDTASEPTPQSIQQSRAEEIYALLQLGDVAIANNLLTTPEKESAWHYYQRVFDLDPENAFAVRGLQRIAARYGELTRLAMERGKYDRAELYVRRGLGVANGSSELLALQKEIEARRAAEKEQLAAQVNVPNPEPESEPESGGFFGALKRFFRGE